MFANNESNHVRPILYYDDINPHSRAVLMILNMLDVDIELRAVEMIRGEHLKPAYEKVNPACTVPTMVHKDLVVTDNAIFAYVCENHDNEKAKQLIAFKCYKRHCRVLSRLFFESQVLHRIHGQLMTDLVRKTIYETDIDYHQKKVEHAYDVMESYLKDGSYMAGSVLTAADISFVACLGALDMMFPIDVDRKRWEKLNDWFRRMRSLPVQKINTNGIEKQRRIVEYFAKFRFAGDVRRYTTGIRDSMVPKFIATHARCSIGVQASVAPQTDSIDQFLDNDALQPKRIIEIRVKELQDEILPQTSFTELTKEIPALEMATFRLEIDATQSTPIQPPTKFNNSRGEEIPTDRIIPEPETIPEGQGKMDNVTERSYGGARKEKPPVPPRRKRNRVIVMTESTVTGKNSDNEQINNKNNQQTIENTSENQKNKNRLNGGVEPLVPLETPVSVFPPTAVHKTMETSKEPKDSSLPISAKSSATANENMKTSSETKPKSYEKNKRTKVPVLPLGLPINGQQVALQYTRGSNAPAISLSAPPPSPDNSSQDEQNDFEFPPPPSEFFLQNAGACEANQVSKLAIKNEGKLESVVGTKSNGFMRTDNSKVSCECLVKTTTKRPSDINSLAGRNNTIIETRKLKLIKKTKPGFLIASGTKSPSSNISIASLGNDKAKKAHKPLKEINTMQKLITSATSRPGTISQEKKTRKLENGSGLKMVESSGSTVNGSKRVKGGSLNSTGTVEIDHKYAGKKRRVEGGGQWRSKEKTLTPAIETHAKLLNNILKESKAVEPKSAGVVQKQELQKTEISNPSISPPNQSPAKGKTATKITTKNVKRESKSVNQASSSKNNVKVYPTKIPGRTKTKATKIFDTSPFIVGVNTYKSQPNVDTVKRAVKKIKRRREEKKAVSEEILSVSQSLPFETPCSSIPELKCAIAQSTIQQNTNTASPISDCTRPVTTDGDTSQTASVPEANRTLQLPNIAVKILPTNEIVRTGNGEEVSSSALKGKPMVMSLVAKTMQTLAAAAPNFRPAATNIMKILPPKPPPLPPPPLPVHYKLPPPPSPPLNLSSKDALPQAGTVAKALRFLSAATSEAYPLCGTIKPFRKTASNIKSMKQSTSVVVNNAAPNENVTCIVAETAGARPLAEILTATVRNMSENKVEKTNKIETTNETEQSFAKSKKLSDKMLGNVAQAAAQVAEATNPNQMADTVVLDCQNTQSSALNEVNKPANEVLVNIKEDKQLKTEAKNELETRVKTTTDTDPQLNSDSLQSSKHVEQAKVEEPPTKANLKEAAPEPPKAPPDPLVSEVDETEKSSPSSAACTNTAIVLTESPTRPTQSAQNSIIPPQIERNIIHKALISENIVVMEPTASTAQPKILITGYTQGTTTMNPLFASAGPTVRNTIIPALRAHSVGPCSFGPSANVVISTFGYTPMSDFDSTPEQLLPPIRPKYVNTTLPLPSFPTELNSTNQTALSEKTEKQCVADETGIPARGLSPRMREERPYPTAHRSRSQQVGDRKIIIRGRVM